MLHCTHKGVTGIDILRLLRLASRLITYYQKTINDINTDAYAEDFAMWESEMADALEGALV